MDDVITLIGPSERLHRDPIRLDWFRADGDIRDLTELAMHYMTPYKRVSAWLTEHDIKYCSFGFKSTLDVSTWTTLVTWLISFDNVEEKTLFMLSKDHLFSNEDEP